jgi:hypothetical protein
MARFHRSAYLVPVLAAASVFAAEPIRVRLEAYKELTPEQARKACEMLGIFALDVRRAG